MHMIKCFFFPVLTGEEEHLFFLSGQPPECRFHSFIIVIRKGVVENDREWFFVKNFRCRHPYRKVDLLNRSPAHHVNRNLTDAVKNADFQPFFDKDPGIASVRKLSQNFSCPLCKAVSCFFSYISG